MTYHIAKYCRTYTGQPYWGPSCEWAGIDRGQTYATFAAARADVERLAAANPVGWRIIQVESGEEVWDDLDAREAVLSLEQIPAPECDAIWAAWEQASRGVMNYYVGRHGAGEYRVFSGRDWLGGWGVLGWQILWGVWPSGVLIPDPGCPLAHPAALALEAAHR